jgi:hypothetical protein
MIFADLELARRLELPEAIAGSRFVEARNRVSPELGAQWIRVAGTYAMFDGPCSPVSQTFGLGVLAEPTDEDLATLESFFQQRGAPVCHEVSPLAGLAVAELLSRRGYKPIEFTSVLYKPILPGTVSPAPSDSRLRTRLMATGENELWAQISARGWGEHPEWTEFLLSAGRLAAQCEGLLGFIAELDGRPVANGALWCHESVALMGGACTVPEARRQGAQRALFECRMAAALARGCDLAMMCAEPGSASQRNAERQGFRVAYTRIKWRLAPAP